MDIIGGIGNLVSGLLGYEGARQARSQQMDMAEQNIKLQKEFAQQGIRWKVEDAQAAGIHPLYALGASTASYSPVSVGSTNVMSPLADMARNMGQDLSRSVEATRTRPERDAAQAQVQQKIQTAGGVADVQEKNLRNELLRLQIQRLRQSVNPPMPTAGDPQNYEFPGAGNTTLINPEPMKVAPGSPQQPSSEGGSIADVGYARTKTGWAPVPSKDVKERIEDQFIPEMMWAYRNNVLPSFGHNSAPPPFPAPKGQAWIYDVFRQEYRLKPIVKSPYGYPDRPAGWYIR